VSTQLALLCLSALVSSACLLVLTIDVRRIRKIAEELLKRQRGT
jgi:hypothetical protein